MKGKIIYSPKGKAAEYGSVAANIYNRCSNGCSYCYLNRGVLSHTLGSGDPSLKSGMGSEKEAIDIFCKELDRYRKEILEEREIFFTFSSDPCLKETMYANFTCMAIAMGEGIACRMLTKRADWLDTPLGKTLLSLALAAKNETGKDMLYVGFTLTGRDDLEPHASPNLERIAAMKILHGMGISTWASIEPVIDIPSSLMMIRLSKEVCGHYKIGLLSGGKRPTKEEVRSFMREAEEMARDIYWKKSVKEYVEG